MIERKTVTDRRGRVWTVSKVPVAEAADLDVLLDATPASPRITLNFTLLQSRNEP